MLGGRGQPCPLILKSPSHYSPQLFRSVCKNRKPAAPRLCAQDRRNKLAGLPLRVCEEYELGSPLFLHLIGEQDAGRQVNEQKSWRTKRGGGAFPP